MFGRSLAILAVLLSFVRPLASAGMLAATAVTLEGQVQVQSGDAWAPVALGQWLGAGDRVRTLEASSLHLVLADGSSLSLGPNTELSLEKLGQKEKPGTLIQLFRGAVHAIVEKLTLGQDFKVRSSNAVAAVKGTEFQMIADDPENTEVIVAEGEVFMGDSQGKSGQSLRPLDRLRLNRGRWGGLEHMGKREAGPWIDQLTRARLFHKQRSELLKGLRGDKKARKVFEKQLKQRHDRRLSMYRKHKGKIRKN